MKLNILPSKGGGIMFPAFDYNHEKDECRNGYDNGCLLYTSDAADE